jgi:Na+/melibiose symporter-like transporter
MLADVADEQELITHKRQEGVFYGAYAFVTKATYGFGAAVGGVTLDLIHWPTGAGIRTAADIPPDVLFKLAMIGGPGLAIGLFPALWCFNHYTLNHHRLASIHAEIGARAQVTPGRS